MPTVTTVRAAPSSVPLDAHAFNFPTALAYASASLFVLASGGANLIYGLAKGTDTASSLVWGAVSVAVTLGAALSWPAFTNAIDNRKLGRASMAAIGILVFTSYSIVAALGSAAGARIDATNSEQAQQQRQTLARTAHDTAAKALATIDPARSEAELRPLINTLLATPNANRCEKRDGDVSRRTCAKVDDLEAEAARAARRAKLETQRSEAAAILAEVKPTRAANTDAKALAGFLAAVGVHWDEERLNKVLTLLAVIVIEIGAGVSLSLAMSLQSGAKGSAAVAVQTVGTVNPVTTSPILTSTGQEAPTTTTPPHAAMATPAPTLSTAPHTSHASHTPATADAAHVSAQGVQPETADVAGRPPTMAATGVQGVSVAPAQSARDKVLAVIAAAGPHWRGSQRELADACGCSPSRVAAVLRELRTAGLVNVRASATGSVVALA